MKVILKQDVDNVGKRGDIVNVAPGFGRNYLIPKKMAAAVTASNLRMVEIEHQALKKRLEKERLSYQDLIQKLNAVSLRFSRKAGEKDMIFGSVSLTDIKDALQQLGFEVDKKKIVLEEPIKRLGRYTIPVKVFHEDQAEVKLEVVRDEAEGTEDKKKAPADEPAQGE